MVFIQKKMNAGDIATSNGCGQKRTNAVNKLEIALEAGLAEAKTAHARLIGAAAQSKASAKDALVDL